MPALSSSSRQVLLDLARRSIQACLEGEAPRQEILPASMGGESAAELAAPRGCFVTLREKGELRGCVGTFEARHPLFRNVMAMAVAASFRDSRFFPLKSAELDEVRIEISILGERRKMTSTEELVIGRHGIFVECGAKSGTYLPEVALEQGWSPEEFVVRCAREKAGLTAEELNRAQFFLFEVEKIKEAE